MMANDGFFVEEHNYLEEKFESITACDVFTLPSFALLIFFLVLAMS